MEDYQNSLISTQKSDSDLQIALHPLVLLTISDHITRHHARQQTGPIVGALIGRQKEERREITLEYAFECRLVPEHGILDQAWFEDRLKQFKDVHKVPQLDLMGWFTNAPISGPSLAFLPVHHQIMAINDSAVLLAFHPSLIMNKSSSGGKLPLTIYESVVAEDGVDLVGEGELHDGEESLKIKFREVPYSIETGEAEMISVDFIAKGRGNAAVTGKQGSEELKADAKRSGKQKEKEKDTDTEVNGAQTESVLLPEEYDLIATLTARLNATRMLHSRISLLRSYLSHLPPSYLHNSGPIARKFLGADEVPISYPVLRSISALVSRLKLLNPASSEGFDMASMSERNDVNLINLLGSMGRTLTEARDVGRKFQVVETGRLNKKASATIGGGPIEGLRGTLDDMFSHDGAVPRARDSTMLA